jgi:hypothetical protein
MIPHSLVMLDHLVKTNAISKEAAVRIEGKRDDLLSKVASDFVAAGEDGHEKTANIIGDMIAGVQALGRGEVNKELLHRDPTLYAALNKAYQQGGKDAKKALPQMAMSMGSPWRTAAALVALATGARAAGEVASVATDRIRRRDLQAEVSRSKSRIFDLNPQLLEDKKRAEATFDELARFAPSIAASPDVAANFVSSSLTRKLFGDAAAIDPTQAGQLLQAQKTYESIQDHLNPSSQRMGEGISKDIGAILKSMTSGELL